MSEKSEKAKALFVSGANCSQAVLGAFAAECGLTPEQAFKIASGFGGGVGRMREVCGAVSGMVLAANYLYGSGDISDKANKDNQYALVQLLAGRFKAETGSIVCRELLGLERKETETPVSEKRTDAYYRKRPCAEMVALAAQILEEYAAGHQAIR